MKKILIFITVFVLLFLISSCGSNQSIDSSYTELSDKKDYDYWYKWASDNDVDDFDYCDDEFWSSYWWAEDWCNEYVQENHYNWDTSFWGYECTEGCGWHEAGSEWSNENGIETLDNFASRVTKWLMNLE